jgi:hypothetical protein
MKPPLDDESVVTSPVSSPVLPGPAVVSEAVVLGIVVPGAVVDDVDVSCMLVLESSAAPPSESSTRGPHADIAIPIAIAIVGATVSRCAVPQNGQRESRDIT